MSNENQKVKLGRRPSEDPIIPIQFYVKKSLADVIGKVPDVREFCRNAVEKQAKRLASKK